MSLLIQPIPEEIKYLFQPSSLSDIPAKLGFRGGSTKPVADDAPVIGEAPTETVSTSESADTSAQSLPTEPKKTSFAQKETSDAHPADLVSLLSPGRELDQSLVNTLQAYKTVTKAFSALFSFPYLEDLQAVSYDSSSIDESNAATAGTRSMNTRQFLLRGNSNFRVFSDTEIQLCRRLKSYAGLIDIFLSKQTVAGFTESMGAVVTKYSAEIEQSAEQKEATLDGLSTFVTDLNKSVGLTSTRLELLVQQIRLAQSALNNLSVGSTLVRLLKELFNLHDDKQSALTQLSILLSIGSDLLEGTFDVIFRSKSKLQALITSLDSLLSKLRDVNTNLSVLSMGITASISAGTALSAVWTDIAQNFEQLPEVEGFDEKLPVAKLAKVSKAWQGIKQKADTAIDVLAGAIQASSAAADVAGDRRSASSSDLPLPRTPEQLELFKLARDVGAEKHLTDSKSFEVLNSIAANSAIIDRLREKLKQRLTLTAVMSNMEASNVVEAPATEEGFAAEEDPQKQLQEQINYLGPPADVMAALDTLSGDCVAVKKQFSDILSTPGLSSLLILNPFKTADTPNEKKEDDIQAIVVRYQTLYNELQADSVNCIRGLISYAALQSVLLPKVTPFAPLPGQISLDKYLESSVATVDKYRDDASALSRRYTQFKLDWEMAMTNLNERIAKCEDDVKAAEKAMNEQAEKYKSSTLKGVLGIFGALALFALGAFTLPFGLLAISAGVGLLTWSIHELVERGKLTEAIEGFRSAIRAATATKAALTALKEPMRKVADSCAKLTKVWGDLAQTLTDISAFMATWEVSTEGFVITVDEVIKGWVQIRASAKEYISIISGAKVD